MMERRPRGVVGICPKTGKYQYRTKVDAMICMTSIRTRGLWEKGYRETPPSNVYECPSCKRWHLTSYQHRHRFDKYQNEGKHDNTYNR